MFYLIVSVMIGAAVAIGVTGLSQTDWQSSPIAKLNAKLTFGILRNVLVFAGVAAALSAYSLYLENSIVDRYAVAELLFVSVLSGAVGFGELISRYRDDPKRTLASTPTAIYVSVNVAAGIAALALVKQFHVFKVSDARPIYEVLLAGFGSIAFFRTSFFTARVGTTDVGIGPATLLKSLLDSSDRMNDREQAVSRADIVANVMKTVDFGRAKASLPTLCMMLVETLTEADKAALADQVGKLVNDTSIAENTKSQLLGVYLLRQFGALVLSQAVTTLGSRIIIGAPSEPGAGGSAEATPSDRDRPDFGQSPDRSAGSSTGPTGASGAASGAADAAAVDEAGATGGGPAAGPTGATGVAHDDPAGATAGDATRPGATGPMGTVTDGPTGGTETGPGDDGDSAAGGSTGATGAVGPGPE